MGYEERQCPTCPDCVENEMHAIFHCRSYTSQRLTYDDLFEEPECLRSFLGNNSPHRVAQFLEARRNVRLHHVSHNCTICSELSDSHKSE